jgi:hypothetical protein
VYAGLGAVAGADAINRYCGPGSNARFESFCAASLLSMSAVVDVPIGFWVWSFGFGEDGPFSELT